MSFRTAVPSLLVFALLASQARAAEPRTGDSAAPPQAAPVSPPPPAPAPPPAAAPPPVATPPPVAAPPVAGPPPVGQPVVVPHAHPVTPPVGVMGSSNHVGSTGFSFGGGAGTGFTFDTGYGATLGYSGNTLGDALGIFATGLLLAPFLATPDDADDELPPRWSVRSRDEDDDAADDAAPDAPREELARPALRRRTYVRDRGEYRQHDARQGALFSLGIGGGSQYVSAQGAGRAATFDFDLRLGYGFSDRFQLFGDLDFAPATHANDTRVDNWTATLRGQTVLLGDREGNGLNVNAGIGLGGISIDTPDYTTHSQIGLALGGGLSFDARVGRSFALSPELFATWHAIPGDFGRTNDIATTWGLRLNLLWYGY